jgi:ATP-binding cassette subfamily B protein
VPNPPEKNFSDHAFHYVLKYLKTQKTKVFLACMSIFIAATAVLSSGIALRLLVEEGFQRYAFYQLPLFGLALSILFLAIGSFGRSFYAAWLGEKITTDIRTYLFEKLLHLDISFFDTTKAGEIVAHFTEDLLKIQHFFGHSLSIILRNLILFSGSVILIFLSSPWLFAQTIGCVFIIFTPLIFMAKKIKRLNKEATDHKEYVIKITDEVFNAIKTVQAFVQEDFFIHKFKHLNKLSFSLQQKRLLLRSFFVMLTIILVALFISYIAYVGLRLVEQNSITYGQLISFLYFTFLLASSMSSFPELINDYQGTLLAIENLRKLENHGPCIVTPEKPKTFQNALRGIVAIHKVSFAYPSHPSYKVINDLTLSLSPGERLAIVGPSGAGKSSLFSLLLRFYDPQSGVIYVDGLNVKDIPLKQLRQIIGIVPQDPDIFSMSIYENIIYGNPLADPEDIQYIVDSLHLDAIFEKLPHGPHTIVGNKGVRLSGGQKQRIAIARALIKKPKLLLLDEATSHLDAASEEIIQKCLKEVMKQCSTIIVAHRLSTVLSCDRIAVLNNGTLEEIGTHAELIVHNGLYRQLAAIQFQDAGRFKA